MVRSINNPELISLHEKVSHHPMYKKIRTIDDLKKMMETHVFAVWDFMSLLKRLQREITCVELPWRPSSYPKNLVRLINEIVLGEESDVLENGEPMDHFTLYMLGMQEVGADSKLLLDFILDLDYSKLTRAQKSFVQFNLNLAMNGKIHEVAAAFFYGREKLIPDMFTSILNDVGNNLKQNGQEMFPYMRYYLERHIEVDGGVHSNLSRECLAVLCGNNEEKWKEAEQAGIASLKLRAELWDEVEASLV